MQRDVYLLGDSDAEIEHLVNQAEVYAAEADQLLERIGIAVGATVADVGCGTLGILHLLCARVGPNGRVVGIDREQRMVDYGRLVTKQRNLPVEFFQEDATNLGLPSNEFDFVHCRTLLLNVANPAAVLAEMVRITRPGGVVAVQEPDAAAWVCDPPHPAFQALRDEVVAAYASSGKDFYIGRRLPTLLRCSRLGDVEVIPTARATRPGEFYHTFLLTMKNLVREQILAGGRMSAEEFESHSTALSEHLGRPESVTCQPMIWQAWGTKP